MSLWKSLVLGLRPRKTVDPDFGVLTLINVGRHMERSYWEGEWLFPLTGNRVSIALEGDDTGPSSVARDWYLGLPERFPQIVELSKPKLARALHFWLDQELPEDLFTAVRLSGFGIDDPVRRPVHWVISFETIGENWLSIAIPFIDDEPQEPIVDA